MPKILHLLNLLRRETTPLAPQEGIDYVKKGEVLIDFTKFDIYEFTDDDYFRKKSPIIQRKKTVQNPSEDYFQCIEIKKHRYVGGFPTEVNHRDVIKVLEKFKHVSDKVFLYTGVDGSPTNGNRYKGPFSDLFLESDMKLAIQNIQVVDVSKLSRDSFLKHLKRDGYHIMAWCFGLNNPIVRAVIPDSLRPQNIAFL